MITHLVSRSGDVAVCRMSRCDFVNNASSLLSTRLRDVADGMCIMQCFTMIMIAISLQ